MGDTDGKPGGLGPSASCDPNQADDVFAHFSNFATLPADQAHTVAAPGVCVAGTCPSGSCNTTDPAGCYCFAEGTSLASPIVAGTVALCIASGQCAGLTPAQIVQKIVGDAQAYNLKKKNASYGFVGDPLRPQPGMYF